MKERICILSKEYLGVKETLNKCWGKMTRHHVQYLREGGRDTEDNIVDMCEGHQKWVHSTEKWGGEDFMHLTPKEKRPYHE